MTATVVIRRERRLLLSDGVIAAVAGAIGGTAPKLLELIAGRRQSRDAQDQAARVADATVEVKLVDAQISTHQLLLKRVETLEAEMREIRAENEMLKVENRSLKQKCQALEELMTRGKDTML